MQNALQEYTETAEQSARDQLILSHLWLVRHIVSKLVSRLPSGVDRENLDGAGLLGLVEAADRYDPSVGIEFKLYGSRRIRGAVLDELRRSSPLPQAMLHNVALVAKAQQELTPPIAIEQLVEHTGLSRDQVLDCLAAIPLTRVGSLGPLGEDACCDPIDPPDIMAEREDQKQLLVQAIEALPERDRVIVTLYYMRDLRLKEIGETLNLSESRVSRLLAAAQFQLGEYLRAKS